MAGIYLHIPFCKKKCPYCNFFSLASEKNKKELVSALLLEMNQRTGYLSEYPVDTIYFGGGTPSLVHPEILTKLIDGIVQNFMVSSHPEITIELNPDDMTPEYVHALQKSPFNRVSIGVQSFFDEDLRYLERIHHAKQALKSVTKQVSANISVDLIYGIPTLTHEHWEKNLETLFQLNIPHISAYALTVEPKTTLAWLIEKGKTQPVSEEIASIQFEILMQKMEEHGYLQYEISNFCIPGFESKHNSNYWKGIPYLGLGPSAHSFNGNQRQWNVSNISSYIQGVKSSNPFFEGEILTKTQKYNEYVMTSLRTIWGCDLTKIKEDFGEAYKNHFHSQSEKHTSSGLLQDISGIYYLSPSGKLLADMVSSDLFFTD